MDDLLTQGTGGGRPVRRRWLVAGLTALVVAVLLAAGFGSGLITVYDAPGNAGVVVGWECHDIGLEVRGNPGFFVDSCG